MKPAFPPDHHFHRRRRAAAPKGRAARGWRPADIAAEAERGIAYLSRQIMPAFDGTDPRDPERAPS